LLALIEIIHPLYDRDQGAVILITTIREPWNHENAHAVPTAPPPEKSTSVGKL
jgi:hypothetical protein